MRIVGKMCINVMHDVMSQYEITYGSKNRLLGRNMTLNMAGFIIFTN